jgi:hypothetical protein
MTTETPPDDWVLIEAVKRSGFSLDICTPESLLPLYRNGSTFTALCDMIQKHEKPPVDRKLLCAREAISVAYGRHEEWIAIRAIELWEEGFGK